MRLFVPAKKKRDEVWKIAGKVFGRWLSSGLLRIQRDRSLSHRPDDGGSKHL
jgi:hypothetical protein